MIAANISSQPSPSRRVGISRSKTVPLENHKKGVWYKIINIHQRTKTDGTDLALQGYRTGSMNEVIAEARAEQ